MIIDQTSLISAYPTVISGGILINTGAIIKINTTYRLPLVKLETLACVVVTTNTGGGGYVRPTLCYAAFLSKK